MKVAITYNKDFSIVLEGGRIGMFSNMAYGIQGESPYAHIPSMPEMPGIAFIGSNP